MKPWRDCSCWGAVVRMLWFLDALHGPVWEKCFNWGFTGEDCNFRPLPFSSKQKCGMKIMSKPSHSSNDSLFLCHTNFTAQHQWTELPFSHSQCLQNPSLIKKGGSLWVHQIPMLRIHACVCYTVPTGLEGYTVPTGNWGTQGFHKKSL